MTKLKSAIIIGAVTVAVGGVGHAREAHFINNQRFINNHVLLHEQNHARSFGHHNGHYGYHLNGIWVLGDQPLADTQAPLVGGSPQTGTQEKVPLFAAEKRQGKSDLIACPEGIVIELNDDKIYVVQTLNGHFDRGQQYRDIEFRHEDNRWRWAGYWRNNSQITMLGDLLRLNDGTYWYDETQTVEGAPWHFTKPIHCRPLK